MNWLLLLGGAAAVAYFVIRKHAHAPGLDHGDTWSLVKDASPKKPQPNGSMVPIWYLQPVDPSDRWAALVKQHGESPAAFPAVVLVLMVQASGSAKPKTSPGPLPQMVEVISQAAAKDGSLSGKVIRDVVDIRTLGFSGVEDTSWMPPLDTVISFVPADVVVQVQP